MKYGTDWTDAETKAVIEGWAAGASAAEIARRLPGRNENQVIGKVHRLDLPPRRSPIRPRDPAFLRAVIVRAKEGASGAAIARALGVPAGWVYSAATAANLPMFRRRNRAAPWKPDAAAIIAAYHHRPSARAIALAHGVAPRAVLRLLRQHGVKLRTKRGPVPDSRRRPAP